MFGTFFSKALELFGRSFLLASFLPCIVVLAVVMLWLDPNYFLDELLLAWIEEDSAGRKFSIALLILLGTYLVAYVVYGLRNALVWLFRSGGFWVVPALIRWRRREFIQRRRALDEQKGESLRVPQATAWVMAGFPAQDGVDMVYRDENQRAEQLLGKIERSLTRLERAQPSAASRSLLPIDMERTLEEVLVLLHELSLRERDSVVEGLIGRVQDLAGTQKRLNEWCRSIQKRTYGEVAAAFSEGAQFPPEKYVQPTLLGNVMSWMETYPKERYGLDLDLAYPRLRKVIDEDYASLVEDRKMFFDFAIIFATLCLFAVVLFGALCVVKVLLVMPALVDWRVEEVLGGAGAMAARMSWLQGVAAVGFWTLASVAFYRISVLSARSYGVMVHGAVDLYRFQLLEALKLKLPSNPQEEKRIWTELNRSFYESTIPAVTYDIEGAVPTNTVPADPVADEGGRENKPKIERPKTWSEKLRDKLDRWFW